MTSFKMKNYSSLISGQKFSIVLLELFSLLTCRYRVVPSIKVRGLYLHIYVHSRLAPEIPLSEVLLTLDILVVTMRFSRFSIKISEICPRLIFVHSVWFLQ